MKICSKCKKFKDTCLFSKKTSTVDGLNSSCKQCNKMYYYEKKLKDNARCVNCGSLILKRIKSRKCGQCSNYRGGSRWVSSKGYVYLQDRKFQNHPNAFLQANRPARMLEHVYVMSQHIGRPLSSEESVHHKNGNRQDNRIENLELWSRSQPAGQRVEDKLKWAREILETYKDYKPLEKL